MDQFGPLMLWAFGIQGKAVDQLWPRLDPHHLHCVLGQCIAPTATMGGQIKHMRTGQIVGKGARIRSWRRFIRVTMLGV